jgi:TusA-related sulfurtransferase
MNPEPRLIDGRGMEPPEPLERAMAELATLAPGEELVMLLRCEALPLYSMLERNGFDYRAQRRPDGTNEVRISKARP